MAPPLIIPTSDLDPAAILKAMSVPRLVSSSDLTLLLVPSRNISVLPITSPSRLSIVLWRSAIIAAICGSSFTVGPS